MPIAHLELTPGEYDDFISSPFLDERIGGDDRVTAVVVPDADHLTSPGSQPVVVIGVVDDPTAPPSPAVDLAVEPQHLDATLDHVDATPLAATSLVVLLRALPHVDVDAGLAMESAVYSMLQAGPEFTDWRDQHQPTISHDPGPTVEVQRDGDQLTIALNRPHRHNAITAQLRDELSAALQLAVADTSISAVQLRGNGPSFCSGGDLDEFGTRPDAATAHVTRLARSPARLIHQLRDRTTAHLHGHALGGGIEMAAFADHVIAHPDTTFGLPELGIGLIPGAGGTVSLTRRIGRHRTAELALSGRRLDTPTALAWGLIDTIQPPL